MLQSAQSLLSENPSKAESIAEQVRDGIGVIERKIATDRVGRVLLQKSIFETMVNQKKLNLSPMDFKRGVTTTVSLSPEVLGRINFSTPDVGDGDQVIASEVYVISGGREYVAAQLIVYKSTGCAVLINESNLLEPMEGSLLWSDEEVESVKTVTHNIFQPSKQSNKQENKPASSFSKPEDIEAVLAHTPEAGKEKVLVTYINSLESTLKNKSIGAMQAAIYTAQLKDARKKLASLRKKTS